MATAVRLDNRPKRSEIFTLKISEKEKMLLRDRAEELALPVSSYVRSRLFAVEPSK